jgi:hypothetical protein
VSTAQLTLERGKVSIPVEDLCQGGRVRVAYDKWDLRVNNGTNTMVDQPLSSSIAENAAWHSEILATFLQEHKLTPTFIYDDGNYSQYDEEGGKWTGVVGLVSI